MPFFKLAVFCLLSLPFFGCQKQQKEPEIHQIRFGSIDVNYPGNGTNRGYRFQHLLVIDLNTDSALLKTNQRSTLGEENGKQLPKYYTGKIPPEIRKKIEAIEKYALQKENGAQFKIDKIFQPSFMVILLLFWNLERIRL